MIVAGSGTPPNPPTLLCLSLPLNACVGKHPRSQTQALLARRRSLELRLAENAGPPESVNSSRVVLNRSASVGDLRKQSTPEVTGPSTPLACSRSGLIAGGMGGTHYGS